MPHSLRPALLLGGIALLSAVACASSTTAAVGVTHPTMIEVAPESFIGSVPCAPSGAAGLKRYVATLFDINEVQGIGGSGGDDTGDGTAGRPEQFQLPSSLPTPCGAPVGFAFLLPGRHYRVEIDGYDNDDIEPRASGARQMAVPAENGQGPLAVPRWHATCAPTLAVDSIIVHATRCSGFEPADLQGLGAVRIELSSLLGTSKCTTDGGSIDHFDITAKVDGEATPRTQTIACADGVALITDIPAGRSVSVTANAFTAPHAADEQPLAGTTCDATSVAEATIDAECTALSEMGTLRIDLPAALAQLGVSCSAEQVSSVSLDVPKQDKPTLVVPPTCGLPVDLGFAPGPEDITVTPLSPTGDELGTLSCHGVVVPGQVVTAECG